mmetsp:Transcript_27487/g.48844  ORF Transcript_27487/g.48844 Transcript_27487/m.48844 type:complete len:243 (-) Transcript_27487:707-1435(-)
MISAARFKLFLCFLVILRGTADGNPTLDGDCVGVPRLCADIKDVQECPQAGCIWNVKKRYCFSADDNKIDGPGYARECSFYSYSENMCRDLGCRFEKRDVMQSSRKIPVLSITVCIALVVTLLICIVICCWIKSCRGKRYEGDDDGDYYFGDDQNGDFYYEEDGDFYYDDDEEWESDDIEVQDDESSTEWTYGSSDDSADDSTDWTYASSSDGRMDVIFENESDVESDFDSGDEESIRYNEN